MPTMTRSGSRTAVAAVAAALAALIVLSGCAPSSETAAGAPNSGDAALLPPAEGTTKYPLELETPWGETVLEDRPERIAVIGGLGDQESALALDIAPVIGSDSGSYPWIEGTRFDEIGAFVDPWADSFQFEALLAAQPDLIVASTYGKLEDDFERLSTIAPVLAVEPSGDYAWDWRELIRGVGEATDLSVLAEQQIEETEASIVEAAQAHPEYQDRTVSIIINRGQEAGIQFVNTSGSPAEELLEQLGFAEHPNVSQMSAFDWGDVAIENVGLVDAEALVVARHGGEGTVEEATAWLEDNGLYQQLGAVQAEKVAYIDPNPETGGLDLAWAFAYPNALTHRWAVGELTNAFAGLFG
jgi:iron complex transport system substrate-binding protein